MPSVRRGKFLSLALALSAGSASAQVPCGFYEGITDQNNVYNLSVSSNAVTEIEWAGRLSICSVTGTTSGSFPIDSSNSFSIPTGGFCPTLSTSGTFNPSAETASGTITLRWTRIPNVCFCSGSTTQNWTAVLVPEPATAHLRLVALGVLAALAWRVRGIRA